MKKNHSILAFVMAICILLSSVPMAAFAAGPTETEPLDFTSGNPAEVDIWDGTVATGFASGTGTESNPYIIKTPEQLAYLASAVNGGNSYEGKYIKLANDIYLNDTDGWENWETTPPANTWTAIGTKDNYFSGTFDGDGHTVSGIYINTTAAYQGLFGCCEQVIQNLGVTMSYIKGNHSVGGVVGMAYSAVENCYNTGMVSGTGVHVGGVAGISYSAVENCYNTGMVSGRDDSVGGVVGHKEGAIIENCYNTGMVSGWDLYCGGVVGSTNYSYVKNCYSMGEVRCYNYVGGVVGYNDRSTVENCYNTGAVSHANSFSGGVVGDNNGGTVKNCYNTGAVNCANYYSGGVAGHNSGAIKNCYNTGTVFGKANVGGVVGINAPYGTVSYGTVTNCYNMGMVSGENYNIGGVVGDMYGGTAENCYYLTGCAKDGNVVTQYGIGNETNGQTTADVSGQTTGLTDAQMRQKGSFVGFDFTSVWAIGAFENYAYPTLQWQESMEATTDPGTDPGTDPTPSDIWDGTVATGFESGTGTESDPYIIKTPEQLAYLASSVNGGNSYEGKYIKLANDIYLNDTTGWESWETTAPKNSWTAIGSSPKSFSGTFDGDWHTVSGVYINTTVGDQGLFGFARNALIQNLGVTMSYFKISGFASGVAVGGVVGTNFVGTVKNCYNSGSVNGNYHVGGVIGSNEGIVENCYNTGAVTGLSNSLSYIGGVVGSNGIDSVVRNCYNTGTVISGGDKVGGVCGHNGSNSTVINCYNTGAVIGTYQVGGVCGWNYYGTVRNCYNTGAVSGGEEIGGSNTIGGVCGDNSYGTATNCYNTGIVSGRRSILGTSIFGGVVGSNSGAVKSCYNIAKVSGTGGFVGGVCGDNSYGIVTNCYYLTGCAKDGYSTVQYGIGNINTGETTADVSGQTTGLTDAEMKVADNFVGFDFDTVWTMDGDPDYPYPELREYAEEEPELPVSELLLVESSVILSSRDFKDGIYDYNGQIDFQYDGESWSGDVLGAVTKAYGVWPDSITFGIGQDASNPWQAGNCYDTAFTVDMPDGYDDFIIPVSAYVMTSGEEKAYINTDFDVSIDSVLIINESSGEIYNEGTPDEERYYNIYNDVYFDATVDGSFYEEISISRLDDIVWDCSQMFRVGHDYPDNMLPGNYYDVTFSLESYNHYIDALGGYVSDGTVKEYTAKAYILPKSEEPGADVGEVVLESDLVATRTDGTWYYGGDSKYNDDDFIEYYMDGITFDATVNGDFYEKITFGELAYLLSENGNYDYNCGFEDDQYYNHLLPGNTYTGYFSFSKTESAYSEKYGGYITADAELELNYDVYILPEDETPKYEITVDTKLIVNESDGQKCTMWKDGVETEYREYYFGSVPFDATINDAKYEKITLSDLSDILGSDGWYVIQDDGFWYPGNTYGVTVVFGGAAEWNAGYNAYLNTDARTELEVYVLPEEDEKSGSLPDTSIDTRLILTENDIYTYENGHPVYSVDNAVFDATVDGKLFEQIDSWTLRSLIWDYFPDVEKVGSFEIDADQKKDCLVPGKTYGGFVTAYVSGNTDATFDENLGGYVAGSSAVTIPFEVCVLDGTGIDIGVSIDTTVIVTENDKYDAGGFPSYRYEYKLFDATVNGVVHTGIDFYELADVIENEVGGNVYLSEFYSSGFYAELARYDVYFDSYYDADLGGYVSISTYMEIPFESYVAEVGNEELDISDFNVRFNTKVVLGKNDSVTADGFTVYNNFENKRFDAEVGDTFCYQIGFYDLCRYFAEEYGYSSWDYNIDFSQSKKNPWLPGNTYTADYILYVYEDGGFDTGLNGYVGEVRKRLTVPFEVYILTEGEEPAGQSVSVSIDTVLVRYEEDWEYYDYFGDCAFDATVNGVKYTSLTANGLCSLLYDYIGWCDYSFNDFGSQDKNTWKAGGTYPAAFDIISDGDSEYDEEIGGYVTDNVRIEVPFNVYIMPWNEEIPVISFSIDSAIGVDFSQADWYGEYFNFNTNYVTVEGGSRITATVNGRTYENVSFTELEAALKEQFGGSTSLYLDTYFFDGGVWNEGDTFNGQIYVSISDASVYDEKTGGYVPTYFSDDIKVSYYASGVTKDTEHSVTSDSPFYVSDYSGEWMAYDLKDALLTMLFNERNNYTADGMKIDSDLSGVLQYLESGCSVVADFVELMLPFGEKDTITVTDGMRIDDVLRIYYFDKDDVSFNGQANVWDKATRYIEIPVTFLFGTKNLSIDVNKTELGYSDTLEAEITYTFSGEPVSGAQFVISVYMYDEKYKNWYEYYWSFGTTDETGKLEISIPMSELGFDAGDCVLVIGNSNGYILADKEFRFNGFTGDKDRYIDDLYGVALLTESDLTNKGTWYLAPDDAIRSNLRLRYLTLADDYGGYRYATLDEFEKLFGTRITIETQTADNGITASVPGTVLKVSYTIDGVSFENEIAVVKVKTSGKAGDNAVWAFDPKTGALTVSGSGTFYKSTALMLLEALGAIDGGIDKNGDTEDFFEYLVEDDMVFTLIDKVVVGEGITGYEFSIEKNLDFLKKLDPDLEYEGEEVSHGAAGALLSVPFLVGKEIVLPSTFKEIPGLAFYDNPFVTSITIPEGVEKIGAFAFYMCRGLKELVIPSTVKSFDITSLIVFEKDAVTFTYKGTEEQWETVCGFSDDEFAYTMMLGEGYKERLDELKRSIESYESICYTVVFDPDTSVPETITSTLVAVGKLKISGIPFGTTIANLINSFVEKQFVKIYKNGVEQGANTVIGTGMSVCIVDDGKIVKTYTAVIIGDTNGDGDITITDMLSIKANILKKSTLNGDYATAGDTNNDGDISITDFLQIKAQILKKGNVTQRTVKE